MRSPPQIPVLSRRAKAVSLTVTNVKHQRGGEFKRGGARAGPRRDCVRTGGRRDDLLGSWARECVARAESGGISEAAQADDVKLNPPATANTSTAALAAVAPTAASHCTAASPEQAREIADQAWQDGSYQLAGECYLVAGEPAMADRAFVKAVRSTG